MARGLIALGIRPRDHVALLLPNGGDFLRAFFGAALTGAVVVPLNIRYRSAEISYVLGQSDAKAVLLSAGQRDHVDFEPIVRDVMDGGQAPKLEHLVVLGGAAVPPGIGEELMSDLAATVDPRDGQPAGSGSRPRPAGRDALYVRDDRRTKGRGAQP